MFKADKALAGKLNFKGRVNGEGDGEGQGYDVQPASGAGLHAIAGEAERSQG